MTNRLLSEKCETCIFRPGNLMRLNAGRVRGMVQECNDPFTPKTITCHDTLNDGKHPEFGRAVCRGFYDAYRETNTILQIGDRLKVWEEVDPPK